jgi:hypothetical protein
VDNLFILADLSLHCCFSNAVKDKQSLPDGGSAILDGGFAAMQLFCHARMNNKVVRKPPYSKKSDRSLAN